MDFAKRLYEIRTDKRKERTPSVKAARKITNVLQISFDFLIGNSDLRLDTDVLNKIQEIQQLPKTDRNHLFYLVDNVIQNLKAKMAYAS